MQQQKFQPNVQLRRLTPINPVERLAKQIRHFSWLERLWLWDAIRPYYDKVASVLYPNGVEWNINGTDRILLSPRFRMISENHEPQVWKILMKEVQPGDTVADVGAAVGLYTLALAKKVGQSGRVIAFEPDQLNFAVLKEHVVLNGVTERVDLINAAVGSSEGHVRFGFGKGAFSHVLAIPSSDSRLVKCVSLDQVFSDKRLDILKIDTEGYEEEVLKGAVNLLKDSSRSPRFIYIELHPWAWKRAGVRTSGDSLLNLLAGCDYRVLSLDGQPVEQIESLGEVIAHKEP